MNTFSDQQAAGGLTRRHLIAGAGAAAAGVAIAATALPDVVGAKAPTAVPQALAAPITGLTYQSIDAAAFDVYTNEGTGIPATGNRRFFQDITGMQPLFPNAGLYTSLDLPVGAVIKQINAVYQGQPIVSIRERNFATGAITDVFPVKSMTASPGGAFASSEAANVPIKPACSYALKFFCSAGVSIMGATIGYSPASFAPWSLPPDQARVLDTRLAGGKFSPGEERVLDLSTKNPFGSAVVINLTADQPEGTGFLSAYSADIAFPNTSALNYSTSTPNIANTTTVVMGAGNKIKIRCGEARTHVIADVVGYLL